MSQADRYSDALTWYAENREAIAAALPLTYRGTTRRRLGPLDADIATYRAGKFSDRMAFCYVLQPIRRLYRAFEQSKKEVSNGK